MENTESLIEIIEELKCIYEDGYRHDYSMFFPLLSKIQNDGSQTSIEVLLQNLYSLRMHIDDNFISPADCSYNDRVKPMVKLIDHLNLESSRLLVMTKTESNIKDLKQRLDDSKSELEKARKQLDKTAKKAKSMQTEFISLLSIFSAVVLLFFVDTEYIGQAIANMQNGSVFRLIMVLSLCALVLFNGLFILFRFISYIISKNSGERGRMLRFGGTVLFTDIIISLLILSDLVFWLLASFGVFPFNNLIN